ncbi:MAG TPA: ClpX C4-type zinc finger protein [Trebonia sp.]|nr:ClpX C4-type zinc finger protein [Trebonia sp.]
MTTEATRPPQQRLPVRPRPASGESPRSYIRRLARANHLHPAHLRHYLTDPGTGGVRLGWLATLAGRPVASLQHALAGQQPPPPAGAPPRRDPRDRRLPERAAPLWCSFCTSGAGPAVSLVAGPGVCICSNCVSQCTQAIATKAAPQIATWRDTNPSELLASLPRQQAVALQLEADLQDRVDTLHERGVSWARIGSVLGISRQAAWKRFSEEAWRRPPSTTPPGTHPEPGQKN